jgi:hypothetical protein
MARYIAVTEVAKILRKRLKAEFPGVKFSVRSESFSMGTAVNISWTDGPTDKQVSAITDLYQGGRFDSMIDMSYSVDHWLEKDGSIIVARSPGTTGSCGVYDPIDEPKPSESAELVHFGAKFVGTRREFSDAMRQRALDSVKAKLSVDLDHVHYEVKYAGKSWEHTGLNTDPRIEEENEFLSTLIHRNLVKRTAVRAAAR